MLLHPLQLRLSPQCRRCLHFSSLFTLLSFTLKHMPATIEQLNEYRSLRLLKTNATGDQLDQSEYELLLSQDISNLRECHILVSQVASGTLSPDNTRKLALLLRMYYEDPIPKCFKSLLDEWNGLNDKISSDGHTPSERDVIRVLAMSEYNALFIDMPSEDSLRMHSLIDDHLLSIYRSLNASGKDVRRFKLATRVARAKLIDISPADRSLWIYSWYDVHSKFAAHNALEIANEAGILSGRSLTSKMMLKMYNALNAFKSLNDLASTSYFCMSRCHVERGEIPCRCCEHSSCDSECAVESF